MSKTETVADYLKRGGRITKVEPATDCLSLSSCGSRNVGHKRALLEKSRDDWRADGYMPNLAWIYKRRRNER